MYSCTKLREKFRFHAHHLHILHEKEVKLHMELHRQGGKLPVEEEELHVVAHELHVNGV